MDRPLLIMFLGYPGSGKSHFAKQLAEKRHAVRLNGDSMRIALFKTVEAIEAQPDKKVVNQQTFGAIDYAVGQVLRAGHDAVYDANNNRRSIREGLEKLAEEYGAVPIVVWVKVPFEVALKRGQTRDVAADSRQWAEEKMRETMERHIANFDEPIQTERVVVIDGTADFDTQYETFIEQIK